MDISVVVLTYNQEDTVRRAIDSILSQKFSGSFEIIVGDDGSTDRTREICRAFAEEYPGVVRLFENRVNKGVRDNYYDCLLEVRGRYIADCAGDDFWTDPLKLQKEYDLLESNPDVSLVHTGWQIYDATAKELRPRPDHPALAKYLIPVVDGRTLMLAILNREVPNIVHMNTALYRRDIFLNEYRKDPELFRNPQFTCEDIQIEITMSASGTIAYLPDVTLAYQVGHKSITSTESFRKTFDFYFGTLRLNRYIQQKYRIDDAILSHYYDTLIPYLYSQLYYSGDTAGLKEFEDFIRPIRYRSKLKTYIYRFLLRYPFLYKISMFLSNR
ncbi:MAG: glycosyltransferase [Clostridium sp.]|nr:glycosyltransferase [Clostridium sp.]